MKRNYLLHVYTYDSLSNMTFEQFGCSVNGGAGNNKTVDYKHNILNQMTSKIVSANPNNPSLNKSYAYSYDNRGNLTQGTYIQNQNHVYMDEQYSYDSTNRMVLGTNNIGETSEYVFNGLGHLVRNVWTVKQNAYDYNGITNTQIENSVREDLLVIADPSPSNGKNKKDKMDPLNVIGMGNPLNKTTTIIKNFVIDYTSPLKNVIMETETGGFTYRYVYGLEKLSVLISPVNNGGGSLAQNKAVKLYYHQDRLGSVDYLSDNVFGEVASYIDYDEWGAPLKKRVLKLGNRELDMAVEYTGHPWDAVLGLYYAKARMYDSNDRRWLAPDLVRGTVANPITLNRYAYVFDNPVNFVDPFGLIATLLPGVSVTVGSNNISKVYVDSNDNSSLYVNLYDAIAAYNFTRGKDFVDFNNQNNAWLLSQDLSAKLKKYKDDGEMFFDASIIGNKTGVIYADTSLRYIENDNVMLVNMKYFALFMCDFGKDAEWSMVNAYKYNWTGDHISNNFLVKVVVISSHLGMNADDLMAIIAFESGINPSAVNPRGGATGLIQFMPSSALKLGTTTEQLARMSAIEQMDYVYKFLKPYSGKLNDIESAYMAVLLPVAIGWTNDRYIGIKGSNDIIAGTLTYGKFYNANSGLDINMDGKIAKVEAAQSVINRRNSYGIK